jgi:hypothetical protein
VIAIAFIIYFVPRKESKDAFPVVATSTPSSLEQKMVVVPKTIKEESREGNYVINVTYPQLTGLSRSDAEIKINKNIKAKIDLVIKDFKTSNNDAIDPLPGAGASTFDATYSVQANNTIPNVVSMRLVESFFDSGAAHPGHFIDTLNYNTSTGDVISLDDLFSGTTYLERLSAYTRSELKKKIGGDESASSQIETGTTPDEQNFLTFILADTGLIVVFQEYQVAAYAAGVQEILVPYSELMDIIDPNGPLGFILERQ